MAIITYKKYTTPIVIAGILVASALVVSQPSWADGKKSDQKPANAIEAQDNTPGNQKKKKNKDAAKNGRHFEDRQRTVVFEYYNDAFHSGHCPPGLEKKHNGCMPPGLSKKWAIGRAIPRDVEVYELPPQFIIKLGPPPVGYRYIRVAKDILMIAEGTRMVIDAIQDLSR